MTALSRWLVGGLTSVALTASSPFTVRADLLLYTVPGSSSQVVLQGTSKVNPGKTVSFTHAKFGGLVFAMDEVDIREAPTLGQQFNKQVAKAKGDADAMFQAAIWALRHGMLKEYYETVGKTLLLDPKHEASLKIKKLKREMGPLPDSDNSRLEAELRTFCGKKNMKIATSDHFILLHDTPEKPGKPSRSKQRLALLEQVYESFLLTFFSQGIDLEVPRERMKVVLFEQESDFKNFSVRVDASLIHALGYWSPLNNISVFFDHGSSEEFKLLAKAAKELEKLGKEIRGLTPEAKRIIRLGKALKVLVQILQEGQDIEVVSHEATHQLAGNTALFPRHVMTPRWVHEGLAAYFECPNNATWSGIGAVNGTRLESYRRLEGHPLLTVEFIVGDSVFKLAASHRAQYEAYGQAWAMTHFMLSEHFVEFIKFYRRLGEMPPDVILGPDLLNTLFKEACGSNYDALDVEWRSYMNNLKTDIDKIIDEDEDE